MDPSVFDAGFDPDGKRHRSLDLYGFDARFRSSDRFVTAFHDIARCAVEFGEASGASVVVWPRSGPLVLAEVGSGGSGVADLMWRGGRVNAGAADHAVTASCDATRSLRAARIVGREGVPVGLVCAWTAIDRSWPPACPLLLEQLAHAAVAALDEQRRAWTARSGGTSRHLRLVGGPDRRR